MRTLLEYLDQQKDKTIFINHRQDELTDLMQAQGKKVFLVEPEPSYASGGLNWGERRSLVAILGDVKYLEQVYNSSSVREELKREEQEFLTHFSRVLNGSPLRRQFSSAVASYFGGSSYPFRRAFLSETQQKSFYFETEDYKKEQVHSF